MQLIERIQPFFPLISIISTIVVAFFIGFTYWLSRRQYNLYSNPTLRVYLQWLEFRQSLPAQSADMFPEDEWDIDILFVNPGTAPIIIESIGTPDEVKIFSIEPMPGEIISTGGIPGAIKANDIAIYSRILCTPSNLQPFKIEIKYRTTKLKTVILPVSSNDIKMARRE